MDELKPFITINWPLLVERLERVEKKRCYLCGVEDDLDIDHVFPQFIFRTKDTFDREYVKLPCCKKHNNLEKKKVDERCILSMLWTSDNKSSKEILDKYLKAYHEKGHNKKLMPSIFKDYENVEIRSQGGIIIGNRMGIKSPKTIKLPLLLII